MQNVKKAFVADMQTVCDWNLVRSYCLLKTICGSPFWKGIHCYSAPLGVVCVSNLITRLCTQISKNDLVST